MFVYLESVVYLGDTLHLKIIEMMKPGEKISKLLDFQLFN